MALAVKFDKRSLALTKARFRAWWEGEEFDAEAAAAALAATAEVPAPAANDPDSELFEPEALALPARLEALTRLWGEGRLTPGDATAEALIPARLGMAPEGRLCVIGAGLAAPVIALAGAHPGPIDAHEWREESVVHLREGVRRAKLDDRVTIARIDLETHVFEPERFDGAVSFDDFGFCDEPTRLAHHLTRTLKPDACLLVEAYAGLPIPDIAPAFAAAFAEPQIRAAGDLAHFLIESGLKIESQEDVTEEHVAEARAGFKQLEGALKEAGALDLAAARELAWETEAWRARLRLLGAKRLERVRILARRPAS